MTPIKLAAFVSDYGQKAMIRTATCCCGKASIELNGDPVINSVCHCDNCKTRTGSAFGISAYFSNEQVVNISGDLLVYEINNADSEQERYFCSACGTTLYWKLAKFPSFPQAAELTGVAGGCFIENPLPAPSLSASNEKKCEWLELPSIF